MTFDLGANIIKNEEAATAVEFAIVGPVFLTLMIGIIYASLLLYSMISLQYAVEQGARCASVNSTTCSGSSAIVSYTQAAYSGTVTPTFTYSAATCGQQVSGTANFSYNIVWETVTIPLSATACFP